MSRRKRRPGAGAETARSRPDEARPSEPGSAASASGPRSLEPRSSRRLLIDIGILAAVFAATVGIAELAGAANLGVAIGLGQVAFALVLVALLLRG
jgi:hypothetical protein